MCRPGGRFQRFRHGTAEVIIILMMTLNLEDTRCAFLKRQLCTGLHVEKIMCNIFKKLVHKAVNSVLKRPNM